VLVRGSKFQALWWGLGITLFWVAVSVHSLDAAALPRTARVKAVLDGDTIVLESGERVRYLGIDAPEVSHRDQPGDCYGDEALIANRNWVLHRQVRLEYDREKRDGYGRLLAYVLLEDETCVNAALLRGGFAWLLVPPAGIRRHAELGEAQREALRDRRGMWSACSYREEGSYLGNHRSQVFHRPDCPFAQKIPRGYRATWANRWEALEHGYRPCRRCKP
jgi:micrococcal nuclease